MTAIAVFAYASLVDRSSASMTLGRDLEPRPARLGGWRRRWSLARDNLASEKGFAIEPGGRMPRWVLGLNIEPAPGDVGGRSGDGLNGALLPVSEAELERLDLRELRYDRVDVTAQIASGEGFDLIVAYRAKRQHFAPEPPPGAVIIARYARAVEAAFAALGDGQRETYLQTTDPPPVELVEGTLVRDRIPPGNPRSW
jgi:cation transport regulator ChaC